MTQSRHSTIVHPQVACETEGKGNVPIMHGWDLIMRHAVNTLTRSERPKCCSSFVSTALDVGEVPITPASGISTCAMVLDSARPLSQVLRWPRFSLPCVCVYGPSWRRGKASMESSSVRKVCYMRPAFSKAEEPGEEQIPTGGYTGNRAHWRVHSCPYVPERNGTVTVVCFLNTLFLTSILKRGERCPPFCNAGRR